ncbi:S-adenosylmethionine:tRNA ribosyltransferase-isomerase [Haemophilus influenzae 3655]|uniref:Adhesion and penetration autotransporter Hap n=1 Tax=Haemophilus influenzae (strain NTHi 3655) TaxID=375177 RepID=A0A0H3PMZ4_HAEI3|nr:adhesion and penetration autotransporter Hap [Haemophilus influenzae]AXP45813.1 autotransporter outer membrane beta-barrel domain-containing protein [Haemophilus influenzae]AXP64663.1 autotransporter outer membrane beta-barrel domain-containing protein [Haemophilus influenzae]EDJ93238.1 S-adenosylmethionine:tRNA ribosyltransferase-isomerase [Haemophilus influenzae 3655]KOR02419.1 S-adenosylmethionine tRNA ribosyltransferase [Haemophilus influenzae]MCC3182659.1 adhesion and penetration autot
MKKTVFRLNFLTACISLGIVSQAWAGHTYFGIDYQYYRDFAENKGKFAVGAKDIEVYNKKGELVGKSMTKAPMIDFASVARSGYAALVGDQYIVSVAHNGGYTNADFGAEGQNPDQHRFTYQIVKRNNYKPDQKHHYNGDYHMPRLHKFVTESSPFDMTGSMKGQTYADKEKYPMRVRIGSGDQYWRNEQDKGTQVAEAYGYLIAGNTHMQTGAGNGDVSLSGDVRKGNDYGPMPTAGSFGDSGSPMFIYDATEKKWLINGVLRTGNPSLGRENTFQLVRKNYFDEIFSANLKTTIFDFRTPKNQQNQHYTFHSKNDGSGTITSGAGKIYKVKLANYNLSMKGTEPVYTNGGVNNYSPALSHGENLYFIDYGKGVLTFSNNIDQGAGGLYFEGDFIVSPTHNETWKGAGISISDESTVIWKVNGVENDRLSKIGKGTLHVKAKGENKGSISVGDGKVILEQQADDQNKKQAFSEIGLVSGRGTVQLNDDKQFDTDKFYFGFRGGRLDLNGHSLTFKRIQNTDEGAMIVNHNTTQVANVTITGNESIVLPNGNNINKLNYSKYIAFNGWFGETDKNKHNGRLNLIYKPTTEDRTLLLSGGTNLKGDITQEGGTLVFSGRPTPHAYNHLRKDLSKLEGIPQGEIVWDHDWINRTFKAENFQIKGGSAVVSRNVSSIEGNWTVSNNANATFGVVPNQQNTICTRSDWTGLTTCQKVDLTDTKVINSIPTTQINGSINLTDNATANVKGLAKLNGNVTLTNHSQFTLSNNATQIGNIRLSDNSTATVDNANLNGNVHLTDSAQFSLKNSHFSHQIQGDKGTTVMLENATWTMPSDTTLQNLTLNNSTITLNSAYSATTNNTPRRRRRSLETETTPTSAEHRFNTLTVNGKLSGQGTFQFTSSLFGYKSDKLKLSKDAEGTYKLAVRNTGKEPVTLEQLTLIESLDNQPLSDKLKFTLENDHVDAGALRYKLVKNDGEFRLHNPIKEQELHNDLVRAEQAERTLEAKQVEPTAKTQTGEPKVRSRRAARAAFPDTLPDQSLLNALEAKQAELTAETQKSKAKTKKVRSKRAVFSDPPLDSLFALEAALEVIDAPQKSEKDRLAQEEAEKQRKQKDLISRYSNSALSELSATVNSMLSVQDELDRLFVDQAQSAVWTNISQDKRRYDSDAFRAYQQKTNLRQIGVQKALANGRIGAVFSHSRSDNTFDEQVKNHATLTMMSGFAQYQWGDLQFGVNVGTGISASKMAEEQSRKIHRKAINYGVNASYSFHLGQLGIQPYFGVNRYFIERKNYQSEEVKVQTPSLAFNRYNAGVRVDYTFTPTENISVKPYFFVNYVDVSNANVQTTVNRAVLQQPFGRYWQKEVGLKAEILHFQLSAFISKSQGSQLGKQRNMGVKLGYRW